MVTVTVFGAVSAQVAPVGQVIVAISTVRLVETSRLPAIVESLAGFGALTADGAGVGAAIDQVRVTAALTLPAGSVARTASRCSPGLRVGWMPLAHGVNCPSSSWHS